MNIKKLLEIFIGLIIFAAIFSAISLATQSENVREDTPKPTLQIPKNMTFFLHYVDENETAKPLPGGGSTLTYFDTTLNWSSENVTLVVSGTNIEFVWYLCPALADDFTIDGFTFKIWSRFVSGASNDAQIEIAIYERNSTGNEYEIIRINYGSISFSTTPELKVFNTTMSNYTFKAGSSIKVSFRVTPGFGKTFEFYYDTAQMNSRIDFHSADSFRILSVSTLDYLGNENVNFDPDATNKTIMIRATVGDPFGGYDIKWVNLTLYSPTGAVIIDNVSMVKIEGTPISYISVYEIVWNYSSYPSGKYTIKIWAVDNNGYNWYHHFEQYTYYPYYEVFESYFYIGGLPKYMWVRTLDSQNSPLADAEVIAAVGGTPVESNITDKNGMTNITVYPGTYDIIVMWQDIVVANQSIEISENITYENAVEIICDVYSPTLLTVDNASEPLPNTILYIKHPNGTNLPSVMTDKEGKITLYQIPTGNYYIAVRWRGIQVYADNNFIDSDDTYVLMCSVYYVHFRAVDANGTILPNIGISVYDNYTKFVLDFKITNSSGEAITRVPEGNVDIYAYWQDILVNVSLGVEITGDKDIVLNCWIYSVIFDVVDSQNIAVENAQIIVKASQKGGVLDCSITDLSGKATFSLPVGSYYLQVYWENVLVGEMEFEVTESDTIVVNAQIYYLTISAVDSAKNPIKNVMVTVSTSERIVRAGLTDTKGRVTFRLPHGSYTIDAYYKTTYLLTPIDEKVEKAVSLEGGDKTVTVVFSNLPLPIFVTYAFYVILAIIVIAVISALTASRLAKKRYSALSPGEGETPAEEKLKEPEISENTENQ